MSNLPHVPTGPARHLPGPCLDRTGERPIFPAKVPNKVPRSPLASGSRTIGPFKSADTYNMATIAVLSLLATPWDLILFSVYS